ncbi:MAG: HepT-like ribonuclease domain-containing protein [Phormidesmis sp.]
MSDNDKILVQNRLRVVLTALERIPRRFATISTPSDFVSSEAGLDQLDSICMVLIAAGEEFKKIDRQTAGKLYAQYPQVPWRGAIGLRDVLAHAYFQADPEQLFAICQESIPLLIETLHQMIRDLEQTPEPYW